MTGVGLLRNVVQLLRLQQLDVTTDRRLVHPERVGDRLLRHALRPQAGLTRASE